MAAVGTEKSKRQIRQPEKWGGKGYFVCEWTGKLFHLDDEGYWRDYFETMEEARAAGFDECYYYCNEALMAMATQQSRLH